MAALRWEGSPGSMDLLHVGRTKVRLTRWNNCAGHGRQFGPITVWTRKFNRRQVQLFLQLRPFKVGRKSIYLWITR